MMKRWIITIGTIASLLLPMAAQAQVPAACSGIQGATAISPYVQLTLDRARAGLARINSSGQSRLFRLVSPAWIRSSAGAVASMVDLRTGVISLGRNLRQTTTCQHLDEMQIECALAEARQALFTQIGNQSIVGIFRAQAMIQFLQERLQALQTGGLDGTYLDATALQRRLFDMRGFGVPDYVGTGVCGDGKVQKGEECDDGGQQDGDGCSGICLSEMCPFSSDYGEPTPSLGMGCDIFVLGTEDGARGNATPVIAQETQTLRDLMNARASLIGDAVNRDPQHVSVEGCVRGWCEADTDQPCAKSSDCGNGGTCLFGRKVCAEKPSQQCSSDDTCGENGPCTFAADERGRLTPRGAFALEPDESRLTRAFVNLWGRQGERRAWPDAYRNASDYPPLERALAEARDRNNPGGALARQSGRMELRVDQKAQGMKEGLLFAATLDGHLKIAQELKPLRDGVRRLGRMARENDGARSIARNLAYYVLRTCIYRPCNEKLKQIIEMTYNDGCYPYTNGEFLDGDAAAACGVGQ